MPSVNQQGMWNRSADRTEPPNMLVIAGGLIAVGIAADAAGRGYDVVIVERTVA